MWNRSNRTKLGHLTAALLLTGAVALTSPAPAGAEEPHEPGMCRGRSDVGVVLTAHTVGADAKSSRKLIVNLDTRSGPTPSGVLVSGSGPDDRLEVVDWCRLWRHRPGDVPQGDGHSGEAPDDSATIVHAVGTALTADGAEILVRFDARGTDEGEFYRLRYRSTGSHHDTGHDTSHDSGDEHTDTSHDSGDEHDDAWTSIPGEGWAPLTQLRVKVG